MSPASRRTARRFLLLLPLLVLVAGCSSRPPPLLGDPGGVALEVTVDFTRQYLDTMSRWRPAPESTAVLITPAPLWIGLPYGVRLHAGCGRGFGPRYGYGYGYGYRDSFGGPLGSYAVGYPDPGYQEAYLLAGDGPDESELFHQRLRPGHRHFLVYIRPGRRVTLSVQAVGNREGWVVIGHFTSADCDGGRLHIELDSEGSALQAFPPPEMPTNVRQPDRSADQDTPPAPAEPAATVPAPVPAPVPVPVPAPVPAPVPVPVPVPATGAAPPLVRTF